MFTTNHEVSLSGEMLVTWNCTESSSVPACKHQDPGLSSSTVNAKMQKGKPTCFLQHVIVLSICHKQSMPLMQSVYACQRRWDAVELHLFVVCSVKHGWLHIALPAAQLQANDLGAACSAVTCRIIC